jgi:hypothetical protein
MFVSLSLALFVSSAALSALADPPSRAVRLKYISGAVSIQPGGENDWVEGVVNRPLTTADRVWTDKDGRAELHLGSAALRMNSETSMTLTNVSDDIVQIELDQGTLNLHIRHLFGGETYEIDTPNQAFTILKSGDYRFDVDPNADTTYVTVWHGQGEANGQGPGVRLRSGDQASFTGGTSMEHRVENAPDFDGFDDWCRVRDDRFDHARSYQYVSADVIGADDLDDYGTWRVTGNYGPVWIPTVAPGWAPYRDGHWVWVEPWGWTWVDDAPWGFAPSHYGRWVRVGRYWGWTPGPAVVTRPVYAPALVAWVGGPSLSVSFSFGNGGGVAWFPLGWGEPYVPSYHVSRTYFQQVNVTNTRITNITKVTNNYYIENNNTTVVNNNVRNIRYSNRDVAGAVTMVPTRAMTHSESIAKTAIVVKPHELRSVTVVNTVSVAPERNSVLGARGRAPLTAPPARVVSARPVVSRVAPPERPIPFEAKREALEKNPGRPLDAQTEGQLRSRMARPMSPERTQRAQEPAQPVRPGLPMGSSPKAPDVDRNASSSPAHPGNGAEKGEPGFRGRNIPRPPQRGTYPVPGENGTSASGPAGPNRPATTSLPPMSDPDKRSKPEVSSSPAATPATPANNGRAVPRPPQIERTSNPRGVESDRPVEDQPSETRHSGGPSSAGERGRGRQDTMDSARSPRSPQNDSQPALEPSRPVPAPPREVRSQDEPGRPASRPQPETRPAVEQPSRQPAPAPQRTEMKPQGDSRSNSPRSQPETHPAVEQSGRAPALQRTEMKPQSESRQSAPRPQVESRPQRQEPPQQKQSQPQQKGQSQQKHEDKPDHNKQH